MAAKNQGQRIDLLEQQMAEVIAGQSAMLHGQIQIEARLESKLKSIGEVLRNQLIATLKEHQTYTLSKGKEVSEPSVPNSAIGSSSPVGNKNESGFMSHVPINRTHEQNNTMVPKTLRLEFPKFNGDNPRLWLRKCLRYFSYNSMSDYDKLSLVSMNLEGLADNWFIDYIEEKANLT